MAFRYHKYGMIISIDLGTSFSGTCYSVTAELSTAELRDTEYPSIDIITVWPEQSRVEKKTPSIIIYDKKFHLLHWGRTAQQLIEYGVLGPDKIVKERFILGLPRKDAIYKTKEAKKIEYENMRAAIDYLREIFDHTVSTLQKKICGVGHISIEKENIRFVITVPALWNRIQKSIMRTVAKEAGLITDEDYENRLLIINESSAATLHFFESIKIVDGDPTDTFRRCQLAVDSDDRCGSAFIDEKMRDLLTRFFYNGVPAEDKEEENARNELFTPVIDKFINEIKPYFGNRSREFKFPKCKHPILSKEQTSSIFKRSIGKHIDEGNRDDGQCITCKAEDFKHMHRPNFGDSIIMVFRDAITVPKLKFYLPDGVTCIREVGVCKLTIPYGIIRTEVFEVVTKRALNLIDRQIKKDNGNIKRTYLVGGFGNSPYLQKRILRAFWIKSTLSPNSQYRIGTLIIDDNGSSAAMRGALIYGIGFNRIKPQTDVVERKFKFASTDKYNTLICLDIGYLSTSCSYRDLGNEYDDMTEITDWPGLQEKNFMIPTAKETVKGETIWGAQVKQPIDRVHKKHITPSKLMSIFKADLRRYLCEYIRLVLDHVHKSIAKINPKLSDKNKYRYVITMENCHQFFNSKSEMHYIAQLAGIMSKEDPVERLLLIGRDTAAAIYIEKEHFASTTDNINHVLLINTYYDTCSLSLMEHTKVSGTNVDYMDEENTKLFRNVRSVRSATFDFDFASRITFYLNRYVSKNNCIACYGNHKVYAPTYYTELKRGFLDYIKTRLNFYNYSEVQNIPITDSGCCIASIKVYDLMEYIFLPTAEDLASEITRFISETDMRQHFSFDKILLSGTLLETSTQNYKILERIIINYTSEAMNINVDYIISSKVDGKEALLGAALYGNQPQIFTERVARTSYAVHVRAFRLKEFGKIAEKKIEKEKEISKDKDDLKNKIYSLESHYSHISDEKVELFYHPRLDADTFNCVDDDLSYIIRRGDKVLEKYQSEGILKKFYAKENCIVYATIYSSEANDLPTKGIKTCNPHFRKVHQFELYVASDEDDPMTVCHFDIRFIPDNNKVIFEATAGPRSGMISDYLLEDEFLVANIYDDRQFTEVGDLSIYKDISS
ncbi:hypothetical protein INT48_007461 [Thamnidium elegans]|uniref:Uncharacterized protein n=1 Tax=Thamnidium elegans TaxID=101142 RepID=A0A8H7VR80_9FUNG|nr:hypothetical protein INT48_007461 [Thamnidium elegans]